MRVPVIFILVVCLAVGALAGCSANQSPGKEPHTGSASNLETFKTWLAENHGSEEWYGKISSITPVTRLRKPAVLVFVDREFIAFADEANQVVNSWSNSRYGQEMGVRIVTADGFVITGIPLFLQLADAVPPSPASAGDFMTWLDSAFGPAGGDPVAEAWYRHIKSAALNAERQSIEIKTDLNFNSPADRELGDIIEQVVMLARPAGVSFWIVRYGDGAMETSGSF